jgi:hypothetical protein
MRHSQTRWNEACTSICAERNDEFKSSVSNATELKREWSALDDEHTLKVVRLG